MVGRVKGDENYCMGRRMHFVSYLRTHSAKFQKHGSELKSILCCMDMPTQQIVESTYKQKYYLIRV